MHFSKHTDMQRYICICVRLEHTLTTQAHACTWKHTVYTNTDGDKSSAADWSMQRARYDEMDMADQLQKKLNNTPPFSNLPVCFAFFSYTKPSNPAPPPLIQPLSSILLPLLFISAFFSCRILFIVLIFPALSLPPLPFGFRLKTHTQTDSGTERQPGSDLGSEL